MTSPGDDTTASVHSQLRRILANPILNGWGFIVGVISLVFAGFVWWDSNSVPLLSAKIHAIRTILVSPEGVQSLKIFADDKPIKGPVTAVQVALWNAGKAPIKGEDILTPIRIEAIPKTTILSARVIRQTRDLVGLTIDQSTSSEGTLTAHFRILESNDGAVVQITYMGDETVAFNTTGALIGQQKIPITDERGSMSNRKKSSGQSVVSSWVLFLVFTGMTIFFTFDLIASLRRLVPRVRGNQSWNVRSIFIVAVVFLVYVSFIGMICYFAYEGAWKPFFLPRPPFEFL